MLTREEKKVEIRKGEEEEEKKGKKKGKKGERQRERERGSKIGIKAHYIEVLDHCYLISSSSILLGNNGELL